MGRRTRPEDLAKLISEDINSSFLFEEESTKIIYKNRRGKTQEYNIIPELTEDLGSIWSVALAGTGKMGVVGPRVPGRAQGSSTNQRHRRKNIVRIKNPMSYQDRLEYKRKMDIYINTEFQKEYGAGKTFEQAEAEYNQKLNAYIEQKQKELAEPRVGLHDQDEWQSGTWQYEQEFARQYGHRPSKWKYEQAFHKLYGPKCNYSGCTGGGHTPQTWHSRVHRNDTYRRIILVKKRVQSGLPGAQPEDEIREPKNPEDYYDDEGRYR